MSIYRFSKRSHGYMLIAGFYTRGLRVYPYPGVSPSPTRTRGSGTGGVGASRVGSGTGRVITGTSVPGFTRTDVKLWGHIITRVHSFPRPAEFRAEPRNFCVHGI